MNNDKNILTHFHVEGYSHLDNIRFELDGS
jgi:hypothetical protein